MRMRKQLLESSIDNQLFLSPDDVYCCSTPCGTRPASIISNFTTIRFDLLNKALEAKRLPWEQLLEEHQSLVELLVEKADGLISPLILAGLMSTSFHLTHQVQVFT